MRFFSDNASHPKRQRDPFKRGVKVASKPCRSRGSGKQNKLAKKGGESTFKIISASSLVKKHTRK